MQEKRRYIRIEAPIVVTYKIKEKLPKTKKAIIKDFSEGGIRFPIYEKLKIGTLLEMRIETPFDTIPVFAKGEIVWTKALNANEGREIYDAGVKFTKMQNFDKKKISQATMNFLSMGKKYRPG
ncbi:MAG: PilZ domain-containing protein [Candidatus Omnitrophica bacterium]|nr:PilZ domain-containing protein [Candidatus Omnitrophota bacterium]